MAKHNVPENVATVIKEIGLSRDQAGWDCHGTFVLLHKALEKVAAKKKIVFEPPQVIACDVSKKEAVLCVTGHLGDKTEWSIGEAAPFNNKNSYPMAMAEKRAKDRVILKLVGLHGDAYSEDEADWHAIKAEKDAKVAKPSAPAGGSPKLDAAIPVPNLEKEVGDKTANSEIVQSVLENFPGAKVVSVKPNKESLSAWATACKGALESASNPQHAEQVLDEIRNVRVKFAATNGVDTLTRRLYDSYYIPACFSLACDTQPLEKTQLKEVALG
jgi:hypothetical protein